jgi:hypothetical protein
MPNPVDDPDLYDCFFLAGIQSPGVCKMNVPETDEGWEKQESKGNSGGETIHNGRKLIEFDAELYLWKETWQKGFQDWFEAWEQFKPILSKPVAKNANKALDIYHPQLEGLGIGSVVVKGWTEPVPDGQGGATVKIKFLQYAPPKPKAAGKPKGSAGAGGGGAGGANEKPDPNADVKAQIAAQIDELSKPS